MRTFTVIGLVTLANVTLLGALPLTLMWVHLHDVVTAKERWSRDEGGTLLLLPQLITLGAWAVTALPCFVAGVAGRDQVIRWLGWVAVVVAVVAVIVPGFTMFLTFSRA